MLTSTKTAIRAILSADPTLDASAVARAVKAAERAVLGRECADLPSAVVTRAEVAAKLGITPQRVDVIASAGGLDRVIPRGGKRALGFTHASVATLLSGRK